MRYFTICARNYLAYALTLRDSLIAAIPDAEFTIFLADADIDDHELSDICVPMHRLQIASLERMQFQYTLLELSTAIKPFCFNYVFDTLNAERAVFLDPDIQVFQPLTAVSDAFDDGASAVLTPHILSPLTDDKRPNDIDILTSGTFNLGFAAFANVAEAREFIDWWADKLETNCRVDLKAGLFVDQKFVDFAPSFLSRLNILRDPSYNVAYWNLSQRQITQPASTPLVDGTPLTFFHFSGIVPGDASVFSKHQNRISMGVDDQASQLVRRYLEAIDNNQHTKWSKIPYAYATYDDGTLIPSAARAAPIPNGSAREAFRCYNTTYWNAPDPRVDQDADRAITRLMSTIYEDRRDLQELYPLSSANGRQGFCDWFVEYGQREHRLSDAMIPPVFTSRSAVAGSLRRGFSKLRSKSGF